MSLAASAAGRGPGAVWSPTHVQVTVLQARGLRAKGPGGTSDAYAVIQVGKDKYATSVSERSPGAAVWREEATFELPPLLSGGAAIASAAATLQLTVLHRALLGLDKFLGRAEVDLRELHRDQGRRKTQSTSSFSYETLHKDAESVDRPRWFTLKSKPGKKEKDRGEIEVDIQFMRNNMTASMFDLSMKDKSRNPFGKLKDKLKGKNKDSASDTSSAIVPSNMSSVDSDDESFAKDKKKKSKIKNLFSKSSLQKTALSQSMSVLPTSKSDKVLLRPGDFESRWGDDDEEEEPSSADSSVMSHKRTASADHKQINQINFTLPKKDGLSFLGGLRSKNDFLSRSNVCINGNHVYMEQPEAKNEAKDSSASSSPSPQSSRKKHLFSSTENLAARSWKEFGEGGAVSSDKQPSESPGTDSLKSMSLPPNYSPTSSDIRESAAPSHGETGREAKETKKQEGKKSFLSLVTGKKDTARTSDGDSPPAIPKREKEVRPKEDRAWPVETPVKRAEKDPSAAVSGRTSLNPFEEAQVTEPKAGPDSKSEPTPLVTTARAPQTKAVKPRLEVSPEPPPRAMLPSSPNSALYFPALSSSSAQSSVPSEPETLCSESPLACPSLSSPISTSTPIEHWPPTCQGQTSAQQPSLLHPAEVQEERLTYVPDPASHTQGSLSKEPLGAPHDGTKDSLLAESRQIDIERNVSCEESGKPLLQWPQPGQQEELGVPPQGLQGHIPSLGEAQEALSPGRSPREPQMGKDTDVERQPRAFVEIKTGAGETASAVQGVPLLSSRDLASPFDSTIGSLEEQPVSVGEGQKKTKKRVSFSKELFTEVGTEEWPCLVREDPQELTGEVADTTNAPERVSAQCPHLPEPIRDEVGPIPVVGTLPSHAHMEGPLEGDKSEEINSGRDNPLLSFKGHDGALVTPNQSKAQDHEGSLSEPLRDLQSPIMSGLDLSLPSIPEVASDDERIDYSEGNRDTTKMATVGLEAPSLSTAPVYLEEDKEPSGRAGGLVVAASGACDLRLKAFEASATASPEQPTALRIQEADLGMNSGLDKQLLDLGSGEETRVLGGGRPGQPPEVAPAPPVASPSFSETFPITSSSDTPAPHSDTPHLSTAESQKKPTAEGKAEHSSKRKPLLQAWVSPSEAHPVSAPASAGTGSAKHRPHPVKPMNTTATKITNSNLGTATIISENLINEAMMKKYNPSDPAFAYAQLTHDELIQLVLKQKEAISKKEFQVRELEDYIDNLLVRVMEETPNILRVPGQIGKKAGKM